MKQLSLILLLACSLRAQTAIFGVKVGQSLDTIPRCIEPEENRPKDQPCTVHPYSDDYPEGWIDFGDQSLKFETLDGKIELMKYEQPISESESVLNRLKRKFGPAELHRRTLVNGLGIKSDGWWAVWYRKDAEIVFLAPYLNPPYLSVEACGFEVRSHKWLRHEAETHKETQF